MQEVEFAVQGFLIGKGRSATECDPDKDFTTGLLVQFNLDRGSACTSFTNPSTLSLRPTDSQVAITEPVFAPSSQSSSVPTVLASSLATTPPVPAPIPASHFFFMGDFSSHEWALYGKKFQLDLESDVDYTPSEAGSNVLARSESPLNKASTHGIFTPLVCGLCVKVIDMDKG